MGQNQLKIRFFDVLGELFVELFEIGRFCFQDCDYFMAYGLLQIILLELLNLLLVNHIVIFFEVL